MSTEQTQSTPKACVLLPGLLVVLGLAACSGSNSNGAFQVRATGYVGVDDGSARVRGNLAVFKADEATQAGGTILNDDGDMDDGVAIALRFSDGAQRNLGAAPREIEILGDQVYLVVDETNNQDWNSNGMDELVLLHWNFSLSEPEFVDLIDPDSPLGLVAAGTRLWYPVDADPIAVNGTNLRYIDIADPDLPVEIDTDGVTLGTVRVQLVAREGGLIRLAIDETAAGGQGDLNGDLDGGDTAVLALVEVDASPPLVVGTGLAQPAADAPFAAREVSDGNFDVLCLVSETQQGAVNLNPSIAAVPAGCPADTDTVDDVLHLLEWQAGTIASTTNTELAGAIKLLLMENWLVTLSRESDLGAGGCDLTGDGPTDDIVVRWAPLDDPTVAVDGPDLYDPVDTAVPGESLGLTAVEPLLFAAIDTTVNVGGSPLALPWLGRVFPGSSTSWNLTHLDPDGPTGLKLGLARMEVTQAGRLRAELLESSQGLNLNVGCNAQVKDFFVADQTDAIPIWVRYSPTYNSSVASGLGYATEPMDGGVVVAFGRAFVRVSEQADGRDWNLDGDATDRVLVRTPLVTCSPVLTSILDAGPGPSIRTDGVDGALMYCDEAGANKDLNLDGVILGSAVRYFRDY
ncbi:hypothetical protein [Engelhardtia mirabilis]|uniref:Uncharacterized protein n=1 Tax=Engelhardtia mirabilis TaxID=2528011 RepID=A0A518BNA8_9BACT|nr:hypothetical protein Pla133_35650 [Planctomycetes bacterium Pla133]QDV02793.1 hypothetical protein Pla86_35630 [Planctomycetes bacterium Pla86]